MELTKRQFLECTFGIAGGSISAYSFGLPILNQPESNAYLGTNILDLAEAERLESIGQLLTISKPGMDPIARLGQYTQATPEAIEYLSKKDCDCVFLGIHDLSLELVKVLEKWEKLDFLRFDHLKTISPECARRLCSIGSDLMFLELDDLSIASARELARNEGWLYVSLPSALPGVIRELSNHRGMMDLTLAVAPSFDDAVAIAHHSGRLLRLFDVKDPSASLIRALASNPAKKIVADHWNNGERECSVIEICDLDFFY